MALAVLTALQVKHAETGILYDGGGVQFHVDEDERPRGTALHIARRRATRTGARFAGSNEHSGGWPQSLAEGAAPGGTTRVSARTRSDRSAQIATLGSEACRFRQKVGGTSGQGRARAGRSRLSRASDRAHEDDEALRSVDCIIREQRAGAHLAGADCQRDGSAALGCNRQNRGRGPCLGRPTAKAVRAPVPTSLAGIRRYRDGQLVAGARTKAAKADLGQRAEQF